MKLRLASIEIGNAKYAGIAIDDVDQLSNRDVQASVGALFRVAKSYGCVVISTSHEVPQSMRLREWLLIDAVDVRGDPRSNR